MSGTLFIIPTPIGNLEDITLRALSTLASVDVIASEDTRHTGLLLKHFEIQKPLISYEEHNELRRIPEIIARLQDGQRVALVSDAGTPTLSDPGFKLIREVIRHDIAIDSLPGASAITVSVAGSGLPTDKFYFGGFLPRTTAKRLKILASVEDLPATLVFFESPHRLGASLADAFSALGNRQVVIARELTKIHQHYWRGSLVEAASEFKAKTIKGEIVMLISGQPAE